MRLDQMVRFEAIVRVCEFGDKHQDLFLEGTEGKDALTVLVESRGKFEAQAKSKAAAEHEGQDAKTNARRVLNRELEEIARNARVIAADTPGFDAPFALPRPRSDQKLLTSGRAFIDAAEASKDRFIRFGMPPDFVSTLSSAVTGLATAISTLESGRIDTTQARQDLNATLRTATRAIERLDTFIRNKCRDDAATLEVWQECRAVEWKRRTRRRRVTQNDAVVAPEQEVKVAS